MGRVEKLLDQNEKTWTLSPVEVLGWGLPKSFHFSRREIRPTWYNPQALEGEVQLCKRVKTL